VQIKRRGKIAFQNKIKEVGCFDSSWIS